MSEKTTDDVVLDFTGHKNRLFKYFGCKIGRAHV